MGKRAQIIVGMIAGMIWGVIVLWYGSSLSASKGPVDVLSNMMIGLFPMGVVTVLMIGRLAQRRFFDDTTIDGEPFLAGSGADIDQRVLANTIEQIVLALCIWPFAGAALGSGVPMALGFSFAFARILFWVGYHVSPPLRAFGFAATFYPTVLAALWCLIKVVA